MAKLNSQNYSFRPKQGLAANLNTTASKNASLTGELAFTTDGQQLFFFNGTEYEAINKYTSYFYNSSGSQIGNRFNDFADMQESIGGREVRVQFEQDETLPSGAFNVDYQTWLGQGSNPDDAAAPIITFPTGFTFSSAINWQCENGLNLRSTSTSPICVQSIPTSHNFLRCAIGSTTAPFFSVTADGLHAFSMSSGFGFEDDGAPVVNVTTDANPYGALVVIVGNGTVPTCENDTLASDTPIVYGVLLQTSEGDTTFTSVTFSGVDGASVDFAPGELRLFSNSKTSSFREGQPDGIPTSVTNVSDALEHLATHATTVPSSASDTGTAGTIAYDSSYIYICTATNQWRRIAHATW